MATTLSKGYKKPSVGERGATFYVALEENIELSNSHSHNGTDGEPVDARYLTKTTSSISSSNWSAVSGQSGTYSQVVTLPADYTFNDMSVKFFVDGGAEDGAVIMPSIVKASSTSYTIFINDNTVSLKAVYG